MERSSAFRPALSREFSNVVPVSTGTLRPAVFLDRDGVLNRDHGYVAHAAHFEFLPGIQSALETLQAYGYPLVVVTNQSGIGRGYYSEEDYQSLTHWMRGQLSAAGIELTAIYHCPHAPEQDCACRKPAPGMLLQAARQHQLDLARSWMVGDKPSDMTAARRAGVGRTVLVRSGKPVVDTSEADAICDSLADFPQLLARSETLR